MYKVGDMVAVSDPGATYSQMAPVADRLGLKGWVRGQVPEVGLAVEVEDMGCWVGDTTVYVVVDGKGRRFLIAKSGLMTGDQALKKSMRALLDVEGDRERLDTRAFKEYHARYGEYPVQAGAYHSYKGFEVVSERELRVLYVYGGGDMDYEGSFTVVID